MHKTTDECSNSAALAFSSMGYDNVKPCFCRPRIAIIIPRRNCGCRGRIWRQARSVHPISPFLPGGLWNWESLNDTERRRDAPAKIRSLHQELAKTMILIVLRPAGIGGKRKTSCTTWRRIYRAAGNCSGGSLLSRALSYNSCEQHLPCLCHQKPLHGAGAGWNFWASRRLSYPNWRWDFWRRKEDCCNVRRFSKTLKMQKDSCEKTVLTGGGGRKLSKGPCFFEVCSIKTIV